MNCTECLKVNSLPACLGPYADMILTGLSFPSHTGADIVLKITNTATRQVWYVSFTEGEDISIASIYPLTQHWYKMEFFTSGVPINFVLTNPDSTTVEGCCIEFIPNEGQEWGSAEFTLSTTNCVVSESSSSDVSSSAVVYRAILSQANINDAITVAILENSIGAIVWTQPTPDLAHYNATLAGAFTSGKTFLMSSLDVQNANAYWSTMGWNSADQLHLELWDEINGAAPTTSATASMGPNGVFVQIIVYP